MSTYYLLTAANPKWQKGGPYYLTAGLMLAPSAEAGVAADATAGLAPELAGYQVRDGLADLCPYSSAGCREACLFTAGRGGIGDPAANKILAARRRRTADLFMHPAWFVSTLARDIGQLADNAERLSAESGIQVQAAVRLNGTSDLTWHRLAPQLFRDFPNVQFYDYTKNPQTVRDFLAGKLPENYHITYSTEARRYRTWAPILEAGGTVAIVFDRAPETYRGYRVIDGTETDLRFLDPQGVIVGLKPLGRAKSDKTGFVARLAKAGQAVAV